MFGAKIVLLAGLLAAANADSPLGEPRACDDTIVTIVNQTDINFYKTCPVIGSTLFFIDHEFKGPFDLPGVQSVPKISSGYLGPKLKGDNETVDDGVTSISMPDLKNVTQGGILFGYLNHLTNVSLPKLESIAGDLAVPGTDWLRNLSFPALSTIGGGVYLDGDFDEINLPSLKSVGYIHLQSLGNISCPALGKAFASVTFTGKKDDIYSGFTCWTPQADNRWDTNDPKNNPKTDGSSASHSSSGPSASSTDDANKISFGWSGATILLLSLALLSL